MADVEESMNKLGLWVKCHSNRELAGAPVDGQLGVNHSFDACRENGTKSNKLLILDMTPKFQRSRWASEKMGNKLHHQEGNNLDH